MLELFIKPVGSISGESKALGNRKSTPSVRETSINPDLLLPLLLSYFFLSSSVFSLSSVPPSVMAAVWANKHARVHGEPDGAIGIICFDCSHAGESFLKGHTEVWRWTERPQNKYLPSCLQRLGPFLSSSHDKQEDGPIFGSGEGQKEMWSRDKEKLDSLFLHCHWSRGLIIDS